MLAKFFATFFYVGLIPKAPGTFGTLAGILVIYPVFYSLSFFQFQYLIYSVFLLGTVATRVYMEKVQRDDPKEVVIDEVVGVWICIAISHFFLPNLSQTLLFLFSFIAFRFFDIVKPFPISFVDKKMKNALGVMLDDILAGIFAAFFIVFCVFLYDRFY
jgi:phosphatidylglycerophosphatase A